MSYSFTVKAANKAEAKAEVAKKFDEIVAGQPTHSVDRDAAVAVASAFVDVLMDPKDETEEVQVMMNGSLSWREEGNFYSASVNVGAYTRTKI